MSLKSLLDRAFGHAGTELRHGEVAYYCPFCHHHKKKLQVNLNTQNWKCWICKDSNKSTGLSIKSLLIKMKAFDQFKDELKKYKIYTSDYVPKYTDEVISLPSEFKSMIKESAMPAYKQAMYYLKKRGITPMDIIKYNIGYCDSGEYKNRIIIPSYDEYGQLNYFVSRSWVDDHYLKYMNPRVSKEIVGFEMLVNWDMDIILTEGVFDAMAIKRNAIPLFGKDINPYLKFKIISNHVKNLYLVLDQDALENVLKNAEELISFGINVFAVRLGDKDPSELGYEKIHEIINNTKPFDFTELISMKLSL
jgi:DNA primase